MIGATYRYGAYVRRAPDSGTWLAARGGHPARLPLLPARECP